MSEFIGSRTRSKEGPRHVTGRGLYTDDFILPGMLQAMILRSPHAHAKILSVDPSQALTNTNVIAVITPDDIKQSTKPFKPGRYAAGLKRPIDEYAGAVDKVRYVGEPLGAVAARDRGTAEDALELISVEYEPIRPSLPPQPCSRSWAAIWPGMALSNTATSMGHLNRPTALSKKT
jgi:2-furoyl-CoA dehydrogenase large subunit